MLREIRWLTQSGWSVDTLGRGAKPVEVTGTHYAMPRRSPLVRVLSYLFLTNRAKYRTLIEATIPAALAHDDAASSYDLVVLNEIELLPWFAASHDRLVRKGGHTHLDLHEYAPSQRSGVAHRLVFKRFRDWMIGFIPSPLIDTRSTVANGISGLYVERFGIVAPTVIRSCPDFVDQAPQPLESGRVKLVHQGIASAARRLDLMISALELLDDRFTLDFLLVGSPDELARLKRLAAPLGERVRFRDPVDVREVAKAINQFDLEVIFVPPATENLRFGLPNKFFEAVQGRLGLVIGPSVEMVELAKKYDIGVVVDGWSAQDLANTLDALTDSRIDELKSHSAIAARELSSEAEKKAFFAALKL